MPVIQSGKQLRGIQAFLREACTLKKVFDGHKNNDWTSQTQRQIAFGIKRPRVCCRAGALL